MTPNDLWATMFQHLGIDHKQHVVPRPHRPTHADLALRRADRGIVVSHKRKEGTSMMVVEGQEVGRFAIEFEVANNQDVGDALRGKLDPAKVAA